MIRPCLIVRRWSKFRDGAGRRQEVLFSTLSSSLQAITSTWLPQPQLQISAKWLPKWWNRVMDYSAIPRVIWTENYNVKIIQEWVVCYLLAIYIQIEMCADEFVSVQKAMIWNSLDKPLVGEKDTNVLENGRSFKINVGSFLSAQLPPQIREQNTL